MSKIKFLDLPSVFQNRNNIPEYEKHKGKPQLSYSSYNSFLTESYSGEFYANKFLGTDREDTIFTLFGSAVGEYQEKKKKSEYLQDSDYGVLDQTNPSDPTAVYEYEILVDRGSYVITGFIDRAIFFGDKVWVDDFKTGDISKKASEYASEDYNQTTLYCYDLETKGFDIQHSGVILFDRKGNTLDQNSKLRLRLTGGIEYIETPYTRERAEEFLTKFDNVALEIENHWKIFKKYFGK